MFLDDYIKAAGANILFRQGLISNAAQREGQIVDSRGGIQDSGYVDMGEKDMRSSNCN
jgi:hypothetical protein